MRWILFFLVPIAASNTFGALNFILNQEGVILDYPHVLRILFFLGALVTVVFAIRQSITATVIGLLILALGILSSSWGLYKGIDVGSNIAIGLAAIWFILFSFAVKLLVQYGKVKNVQNA